jgi:hypothetical protein
VKDEFHGIYFQESPAIQVLRFLNTFWQVCYHKQTLTVKATLSEKKKYMYKIKITALKIKTNIIVNKPKILQMIMY